MGTIIFSGYLGIAATLFVAVFWIAILNGEDEGPSVMLSLAIGICWPALLVVATVLAFVALGFELSRPFRR